MLGIELSYMVQISLQPLYPIKYWTLLNALFMMIVYIYIDIDICIYKDWVNTMKTFYCSQYISQKLIKLNQTNNRLNLTQVLNMGE